MEMAFTGIPAPANLKFDTIRLARSPIDEGKSCRAEPEPAIPVQLTSSPNLSLVWDSYLPGNDATSLSRDATVTGSPDVSAWDRYIETLPGNLTPTQRRHRLVDQKGEQKNLKQTIERWSSTGRLNWYSRLALRTSEEQGARRIWEAAERRRTVALGELGTYRRMLFASRWRMAVGLGNASSFDNSGITLHPTYGFPSIPAASLKGLVRHYLAEEFLEENPYVPLSLWILSRGNPREWNHLLSLLFGDVGVHEGPEENNKKRISNDNSSGSEGLIAWHDGWANPHAEGWFEVDVLTPHHSDYYAGKDQLPDDSKDPIPSSFLTVRRGVTYDIPLSLTALGRAMPPPIQKSLLDFMVNVVTAVLDRWGIGGKSGSGYGRMERVSVSSQS